MKIKKSELRKEREERLVYGANYRAKDRDRLL